MREGDELGLSQKKLMREMNQYAQDINSNERWSPQDIALNFSDKESQYLLDNKTFEQLYAENVTKPKNIGHVGSIRLGRELSRSKKPVKPKTKRTTKKKTKGCGCK